MILRKEKEKEHMFLVSCADWEMALKAVDADEACTKAVERMLEEYGKGIKISPVMLALDFSLFSNNIDSDRATEMVSAASILANAGHYKWAKSLNTLFEGSQNEDDEI
jgi:hypothetical protein|tara:strand:+ start:888 stop:1211 length:324 start_codon:yes stop_codon:yes gene_type:complete